jgi:COMPASS component SWD3
MKENGELPGHSNRVFCVKFNPFDNNLIASGGWDNTIQLYDIRRRGPVGSLYGPHVCGDAIDFKDDATTILTGSYRQENVLELWDIRTMKKTRGIDWNGPKHEPLPEDDLNDENQSEEENKENSDPKQNTEQTFNRENPAPFIYSAMFNNKTNVIMAGGAGANQVRLFDYDTGNVLCVISDLPKAILTMTKANTTNDFAFGSVDSKIRIMNQRVLKDPLMS